MLWTYSPSRSLPMQSSTSSNTSWVTWPSRTSLRRSTRNWAKLGNLPSSLPPCQCQLSIVHLLGALALDAMGALLPPLRALRALGDPRRERSPRPPVGAGIDLVADGPTHPTPPLPRTCPRRRRSRRTASPTCRSHRGSLRGRRRDRARW